MKDTNTDILVNIEEIHHSVMDYLQKKKLQNTTMYLNLRIAGVHPNDIVKYIEDPVVADRWKKDYYNEINNAIFYIYEDLVSNVEFPEIETQTQEDILLAKILKNTGFWIFHSNRFLNQNIALSHVISFLKRDKEIFNWNTIFLIQVQQEVEKVKAYLLNDNDNSCQIQ